MVTKLLLGAAALLTATAIPASAAPRITVRIGDRPGYDYRHDPGRRVGLGGLDRNRDGVVSRWEWRGDRRSFYAYDLNRDGVLTRWELRRTGYVR